jgi:SAM-dependent methyltransferase
MYDRGMDHLDAAGLGEQRERLVAQAHGRVLEIGAGTGRNLPFYRDVTEVVAVEPDAAMAKRLRVRAEQAAVPVTIVESSIAYAGLAPRSFDTIVCSLVLCSVDDIDGTIRHIDELLAADGRVLALEHVRATGLRGRMQDVSTPLWRHVAAGCHANRDPIDAFRRNGFAITDCDRFMMSRTVPIVAPHIAAVAIRQGIRSNEGVAE